jgi:CRISPR-associated exonuclease Cas4
MNSDKSDNLISGTEFNYYHICHRKLWLFSHDIQMESNSDAVFQGKLIHEHSYERKRKEIMIDGAIRIDFMEDGVVHEVKKSDRMEESHTAQTLYYIYCLRQKGIDIRRGIINYPKQRRTTEVELSPEKELEIAGDMEGVRRIIALDQPPEVLNSKICRKCSYEDFCYA